MGMSEPDMQHSSSSTRFARTALRSTGMVMLVFAVLMGSAHYFLQRAVGRELHVDPIFALTIVLYLAFVFGWGIAYSKHFRFPGDQKILLGGAAGGAAIVSILGGIMRLAQGQTSPAEWLTGLPGHLLGSYLGALLQIYLFVAMLRYVVRIRLPF